MDLILVNSWENNVENGEITRIILFKGGFKKRFQQGFDKSGKTSIR